jgi:hypothetical protein
MKEEAKKRPVMLLAKPSPTKVRIKPKKAVGKHTSSEKEVPWKGRRGAKGK